jgi:hypothetical protein
MGGISSESQKDHMILGISCGEEDGGDDGEYLMIIYSDIIVKSKTPATTSN